MQAGSQSVSPQLTWPAVWPLIPQFFAPPEVWQTFDGNVGYPGVKHASFGVNRRGGCCHGSALPLLTSGEAFRLTTLCTRSVPEEPGEANRVPQNRSGCVRSITTRNFAISLPRFRSFTSRRNWAPLTDSAPVQMPRSLIRARRGIQTLSLTFISSAHRLHCCGVPGFHIKWQRLLRSHMSQQYGTASDTEIPIPASVFTALRLVFSFPVHTRSGAGSRMLLQIFQVRHNLPALWFRQMGERRHAAPQGPVAQHPENCAGRGLLHHR